MLFVLRLGLFVDCVRFLACVVLGVCFWVLFYCKFVNFHLLFEKLI